MKSRAATIAYTAMRLSTVPTQPGHPRRAGNRRKGCTVMDRTRPKNTGASTSENARHAERGHQGTRNSENDQQAARQHRTRNVVVCRRAASFNAFRHVPHSVGITDPGPDDDGPRLRRNSWIRRCRAHPTR